MAAGTAIRQTPLSPVREERALHKVASGADGDKESRWNVSGITGLRLPTQLGHGRQVTMSLSASVSRQ